MADNDGLPLQNSHGGDSSDSCDAIADSSNASRPPQSVDDGNKPQQPKRFIPIEAFGSGLLLHPGLPVSLSSTVGELRELVGSDLCPPKTRTVRLFVGHGGTELEDDNMRIADTPMAADDFDKPVVVVTTQCAFRSKYACVYLLGHWTSFPIFDCALRSTRAR